MKQTHTASCHCGRVRIEADLDLAQPTFRCNGVILSLLFVGYPIRQSTQL